MASEVLFMFLFRRLRLFFHLTKHASSHFIVRKFVFFISFFSIFLCITHSNASVSSELSDLNRPDVVDVRAAVYSEHMETIKAIYQDNKCASIESFRAGNQIWTEAVILCLALFKGGIIPNFQLTPVPTQARALSNLKSNMADLAVFTFWGRDADHEKINVSSPALKRGEFYRGIYYSSNNLELNHIRNLEQLKEYTAVVNENWKVDLETLQCLGLKYKSIASYPQMLRMVYAKRLDFIIHNFATTPDFTFRAFDTELKPIVGIKVEMPDSLHYFISKSSPNYSKLSKALEKGLKILRDEGLLREAYMSVTVIDPRVKDWEVLKCGA